MNTYIYIHNFTSLYIHIYICNSTTKLELTFIHCDVVQRIIIITVFVFEKCQPEDHSKPAFDNFGHKTGTTD